jgi:hypothetical protein
MPTTSSLDRGTFGDDTANGYKGEDVDTSSVDPYLEPSPLPHEDAPDLSHDDNPGGEEGYVTTVNFAPGPPSMPPEAGHSACASKPTKPGEQSDSDSDYSHESENDSDSGYDNGDFDPEPPAMPPEEEIEYFNRSLLPPEDFGPDPPSMPPEDEIDNIDSSLPPSEDSSPQFSPQWMAPEDDSSASNSTDSGEQLRSDSPGSDSDEDDLSSASVFSRSLLPPETSDYDSACNSEKSKESSDYNLATASEESGEPYDPDYPSDSEESGEQSYLDW